MSWNLGPSIALKSFGDRSAPGVADSDSRDEQYIGRTEY